MLGAVEKSLFLQTFSWLVVSIPARLSMWFLSRILFYLSRGLPVLLIYNNWVIGCCLSLLMNMMLPGSRREDSGLCSVLWWWWMILMFHWILSEFGSKSLGSLRPLSLWLSLLWLGKPSVRCWWWITVVSVKAMLKCELFSLFTNWSFLRRRSIFLLQRSWLDLQVWASVGALPVVCTYWPYQSYIS